MVQIQPTESHEASRVWMVAAGRRDLNNPHTAVWGIHKSLGRSPLVGGDLNNPHTAVWGIHKSLGRSVRALCRKDLDHPPTAVTAVGGIFLQRDRALCRKDLKHPPTAVTAVGGIFEVSYSLYRLVILTSSVAPQPGRQRPTHLNQRLDWMTHPLVQEPPASYLTYSTSALV